MSKPVQQANFRLSADTLSVFDFVADKLIGGAGVTDPKRVDGLRYTAAGFRRTIFPLIGEIGAGPPRHIPADPDEYLQVHRLFPEGAVVYRVKGDSMQEALIDDGDYVVVIACDAIPHGGTGVFWVDGLGGCVKRWDAEKKSIYSGTGKGRWMHKMQSEDRTIGLLVGVIRKT